MDRDEFMELVYETFADEPDNVLANGIIEAADAYVEHENAQLYCEGTTSDTISRTEVVEHLHRMLEATVPNTDYDEGYIDGIEFGISTVSTMPTIQPVATDTNVGDTISRQAAIDALSLGKEMLSRVLDDIDVVGTVREKYSWGLGLIESYINDINELPSAQPGPHWIPVSERLPEKSGEYLVSVHHTIGAISVFHPEKNTYVDDVAIMRYYGKFPSTVRAWMPLPEAYKGDEK